LFDSPSPRIDRTSKAHDATVRSACNPTTQQVRLDYQRLSSAQSSAEVSSAELSERASASERTLLELRRSVATLRSDLQRSDAVVAARDRDIAALRRSVAPPACLPTF
jgi:hypothetical protein